MEYCVKSSKDYELLERLLHKISYLDPHKLPSIPCTYDYNGRRVRGVVFEDDWRVFVRALSPRASTSNLEVTMKRNKYTGIQEGMRRMDIRYSIPVEYKEQYKEIKGILKTIIAGRNKFVEEMSKAKVVDVMGLEVICIPECARPERCKTWLIDKFISTKRTPQQAAQVWYDLQQLRVRFSSIPFGSIIKKYQELEFDHSQYARLCNWCSWR